MKTIEFYYLVLENFQTYLIVFLLICVLYYLLLKKYIFSIFDPFFIFTIFSIFASTSVIFLYYLGYIKIKFFLSFLLTQIFFYFGLFIYKPLKIDSDHFNGNRKIKHVKFLYNFTYLISGILFLFSVIFTYTVIGIPLLIGNRLEVYSQGAGIGIIARILEITSVFILAIAFYRLTSIKRRSLFLFLFDILIIISALAYYLLSGSKSMLLQFLFIFFFVILFLVIKKRISSNFYTRFRRVAFIYILFAIIGLFVIVSIKKTTLNALQSIIARFINSGDAFVMGYVNEVIDNIPKVSPFKAIFSNVLAVYRIFPRDELPSPLGYYLYDYHHNLGILLGPNARHNIFGLHYLGFFPSILFSFILGYLMSFIRNRLIFFLPSDPVGLVIYVFLNIKIVLIEADPPMVINSLNNLLIVGILVFVPSVLLTVIYTDNNIQNVKNSND